MGAIKIRGRKPVPAERQDERADNRAERQHQTVLVGGRPGTEELGTPPAHLPVVAQEWWLEFVPKLVEVGLLDRADVAELEMLATAFAMYRMCLLTIQHDGPWEISKDGTSKPHSAQKQMEKWMMMYDRMAEKYGLNPVARTRLGLAELAARSLSVDLDEKLGAIPSTAEDIVDAEVVEMPGLG